MDGSLSSTALLLMKCEIITIESFKSFIQFPKIGSKKMNDVDTGDSF